VLLDQPNKKNETSASKPRAQLCRTPTSQYSLFEYVIFGAALKLANANQRANFATTFSVKEDCFITWTPAEIRIDFFNRSILQE
jgi:hypothetical protein